MGYKSTVHLLQQAEDLKNRILRQCDLLNDSNPWTDVQKLQNIYHQVLVSDLEYGLNKKVEQDLWNVGVKHNVGVLQKIVRDKKNPNRGDAQTLLSWFLDAAAGFYLCLLQELCSVYELDLPFRRNGKIFGQNPSESCTLVLDQFPQRSSCLYVCQYCLVHLGDISRYRNERKQAENYYKLAIQVSPNSGHPYNQLALLEASKNHFFNTVFYYIRAIAVKNQFSAATSNLTSTFNQITEKNAQLLERTLKLTSTEFCDLFLCVHGYLYTGSCLSKAALGIATLNSVMTPLVATESFSSEKLVKMAVINVFMLKHIGVEVAELTQSEIEARKCVLELISGFLSALLVPVHTLKADGSILEYYALPAMFITLKMLQNDPVLLDEAVFSQKLQIWPSFCKFLNTTLEFLEPDVLKDAKWPLPEDANVNGFVFMPNFVDEIDFDLETNENLHKIVRLQRIHSFAVWLTENANKFMKITIESEVKKFEPLSVQPDPTNDLLEEIKSFNISSNVGTPVLEKKTGILKPQGSLEKSRDDKIEVPAKLKRAKQNVALQSIFKKIEEKKEVKFNVKEEEKPPSDNKFKNGQFAPISRPISNTFNFPPPPPQNQFYAPPSAPQTPQYYQPSFDKQFNPIWPPQNQQMNSRWLPQTTQNVNVANIENGANWWPPQGNYAPPSNFPYPPPPIRGPEGDFHQTWAPQGPIFGDNSSLRQAMLKEVNKPPNLNDLGGSDDFGGFRGAAPPVRQEGGGPNFGAPLVNLPQQQNNYSLFNTSNIWNPNLGGNLRGPPNSGGHIHGTQSLTQLLEQQKKYK